MANNPNNTSINTYLQNFKTTATGISSKNTTKQTVGINKNVNKIINHLVAPAFVNYTAQDNNLILNWTAVKNAQLYYVIRDIDETFNNKPVQVYMGLLNVFNDTNLLPGQNYFYKITGIINSNNIFDQSTQTDNSYLNLLNQSVLSAKFITIKTNTLTLVPSIQIFNAILNKGTVNGLQWTNVPDYAITSYSLQYSTVADFSSNVSSLDISGAIIDPTTGLIKITSLNLTPISEPNQISQFSQRIGSLSNKNYRITPVDSDHNLPNWVYYSVPNNS